MLEAMSRSTFLVCFRTLRGTPSKVPEARKTILQAGNGYHLLCEYPIHLEPLASPGHSRMPSWHAAQLDRSRTGCAKAPDPVCHGRRFSDLGHHQLRSHRSQTLASSVSPFKPYRRIVIE